MSHTVPSHHAAVVLRSNYQHLRALLAIAIAVILGLTIAVVALATSHSTIISSTAHRASPATSATTSTETGGKLDHGGRNATVVQATGRLANYPDAPPASASTPQATGRLANYPDAPPASASTPQPSVSYYLNPPQP